MNKPTPPHLFICYAREDYEYMHSLELYLRVLVNNRILTEVWSDGKIEAGADWDQTIKNKINRADIILLLISVDFLVSHYINTQELRIALNRHHNMDAHVIPVLIRSCPWEKNKDIQSLQILPRNAMPVANWMSRDTVYTEIIQEIENAINVFAARKASFVAQQVQRAIDLYEVKRYDEAFTIFNHYLPTHTPQDGDAAFRLGKIYLHSYGTAQQNFEKARYWFEVAAEHGNMFAINNLGVIYVGGLGVPRDDLKGAQYYYQASGLGNEVAQYNLAMMFKGGHNIQENIPEAFKLFNLSAQKGYLLSQFELGKMLINGQGTNVDKQSGYEWIRKAAEQGLPDAQAYLGASYIDNALPDNNNFSNAWYWIESAAKQNYSGGIYLKGVMHQYGYGVPTSLIAAAKYYREAAQLGHSAAEEALKGLGLKA